MPDDQPHDVDAIAAALRSDGGDVEVYARVLTTSLAEALPAGMITVDRQRSFADRLAGRPGVVRSLLVRLGDWELALASDRGGIPVASARQMVRGVAISTHEVPLDQWVRLLAEQLAARARESSEARAALGRLLGQA